MRLNRVLVSLLPFVLVTACDGCQEPQTNEDAGSSGSSGHLQHPDASVQDGGGSSSSSSSSSEDAGLPDHKVITFTGSPPITVHYGDGADLAFSLTNNGVALPSTLVQFALTGNGGSLSVTAAQTNSQGAVSTRFLAGSADADLVVTASSAGATPATVAVRVRAQPSGNINLSVTAQTRIPVTRAEVWLYQGVGGAVPTCAALMASATPTTTPHTGTLTAVPGSKQFNDLPSGAGLAALARGYTAAGDYVAQGCTEGGVVVGGVTSTVTVAMNQLPSILAGDYDVLMQLDLANALPAPYDAYVDQVTTILSQPAEVMAYYVLQMADAQLSSTFLEIPGSNPPAQATLQEVLANQTAYGTWNLLRNFIDGQATTLLGSGYTDLVTVGTDLRGLVSSFEVGSRFHVTAVQGSSASLQVTETWQAIVYSWQLSCPGGDLGCARRPILLANTSYSPMSEIYNAAYTHEPMTGANAITERFRVVTDGHPMPFSYGNLLLIAINEVLVGQVAPSCTTSTGAECHDLNDLMAYIVNCPSVGTWLAGQTSGLISEANGTAFCGQAISTVVGLVEARAAQLVVGGPSGTNPKDAKGLNGSGTFYLVDKNRDLTTELFSDYTAVVQWRDPQDPQFTQDVTAPITGHGRTAASGCAFDGHCTAAGTTCQPVPHYLEVARVELTCAHNVGTGAGGSACLAHGQCASGICVGFAGTQPGACFHACENGPQCGGGGAVCVADRTTLDLDPVRQGLGEVGVQGCNP
ncbi:MAG: hypothetical protein HY904_17230 [Deltaproteobacteria bacterium]|nr:hypothetical protein [Deltaproteobacteria bacterium]